MAESQSPKGTGSKWFWGIFLSIIFIGLIFVGVSFLILASVIKSEKVETYYFGSGEKIAVVEINDVILTSEKTVGQIKKYREDNSIKAIILRINSPGGGVAASQEIYEEVRKTRDSGKLIVVSMGSIAASGGYYIACGSNLIVANQGTITGSIGVIFTFIKVKELAEKIGIERVTIKSGEMKDVPNPFRDVSEKERQYIQEVIDDSFSQFLEVVSTERKIEKEKLMPYANGRVFTGLQAKEYGLIDSLGTYEDAIRITSKMAGIEDPRIIKERKRFSIFERLLGTELSEISELKQKIFEEPILQYKFIP